MKKLSLEVCANGIQSALNAQLAGADRIELCENLEQDGTTPTYGTVAQVNFTTNMPCHVLIRPRPGDFVYSKEEFDAMCLDVNLYTQVPRVRGFVFGILNEDGTIDKQRCAQLLHLVKPLSATFHRAFDVLKNPFDAMEEIIDLGFDRILTSGQKSNCLDGADTIAQLVKQAAGRITIMAGGGITEENIAEIVKRTNTNEFHFSAKMKTEKSLVSDAEHIKKIREKAGLGFKI